MATYLDNIKTDGQNDWVIKRIITSAMFFFAAYASTRTGMRNQINSYEGKFNCAEDIRKALRIQKHVWAYFMDEVVRNGLVIRDYNKLGINYREAARSEDRPVVRDGLRKYVTTFVEVTGGDSSPSADPAASQEFPTPSTSGVDQAKYDMLKSDLDRAIAEKEKMAEAAREADSKKVLELVIRDASKETAKPVKISSVHKTLPELLVRIECGINVFLVGPAGSGKTFAAEQVAETLDLAFGFMSVGPQTTKSDVFGYMNATGDYVTTEFRKRFEEGGVFLFDEIDAAHPGVLTQINAALAGSTCAFPDGMIKKHEAFRCIAAGNTFGTGPDRQYVGRQQMDAASIDRFDFLEWGYDEGLELHIARSLVDGDELADKWTHFVQAVRQSVQELGLRHVVSPRATINGVKLLKAGVPEERVRQTTLYKSLRPDEVQRVLAKAEPLINASPLDL